MKLFVKRNITLLWIFSITLLSFASFWRIFSFGLWKDDWSLIWSSLYNTYYYHGYFNHPGTPLEFFLLSRFFGTHAILWQSFGLLLHIFVSVLVGIFIQELTKSKKAGCLAGIFFSCSYLGLETIYFASSHVIQLATIPLLLSLIYFIKSFQNPKKYILPSTIYFLFSLTIDPPRIAPIIILLPGILFLFPKNTPITFFKRIALFVYPIFFVIMAGGLVWWFMHYSLDTLLGKALHEGLINPSFLLQKSYVLGHFFATIANIFTGLVYAMGQDEQNTARYSRLFGYIGLAIFFITITTTIAWYKTKKKALGIITFFLFWIFLFYLPNWVSEPRAPMAGAHRYVFLSSIGFVGLVAYALSFIKATKLFLVASGLCILLNIYKANTLLAWQYTYRSNTLVTNIWKSVNEQVPTNEKHSIFMFFGAQPWVSEDIGLSGAAPFALARKQFTEPTQMPIFTVDTHAILTYLCQSNQRIINLYFAAYEKDRIPLSHVHAWNVLPGGKLVNISNQQRKQLTIQAKKNGCNVL